MCVCVCVCVCVVCVLSSVCVSLSVWVCILRQQRIYTHKKNIYIYIYIYTIYYYYAHSCAIGTCVCHHTNDDATNLQPHRFEAHTYYELEHDVWIPDPKGSCPLLFRKRVSDLYLRNSLAPCSMSEMGFLGNSWLSGSLMMGHSRDWSKSVEKMLGYIYIYVYMCVLLLHCVLNCFVLVLFSPRLFW